MQRAGFEQITLSEMVECAKLELRHRQQVYPALVAQSKMTQTKADKELAIREAIYQYLLHDLQAVLGKRYGWTAHGSEF